MMCIIEFMYKTKVGLVGQKMGRAAGTINYDLKIEAFQVLLVPQGTPEINNGSDAFLQAPTVIQYSAHVQDIGWQTEVKNGEIAGTVGRNFES